MRCKAMNADGKACNGRVKKDATLCHIHAGAPVGRPSKLTDGITQRMVQILRAGGYVEKAAAAAGVSRATFFNWMERGDPEHSDPADQPYRDFREAIELARAEGEARAVAIIAKEATHNWKAAAWLLERQYPETWGVRTVRQPSPAAEKPEPIDPFAELDELAPRRAAKARE